MNRTPETEEAYIKIAGRLREQFIAEYSGEESPSLNDFGRYLQSRADEWTPSTWRLKKAALTYYAQKRLEVATAQKSQGKIKQIENEIAVLEKIAPGVKRKDSKKTSARKIKALPVERVEEVLTLLERSSSKYKKLTQLMLVCGEITGLRPHEWKTAEIKEVGEKTGIEVENGKNTNGRANGTTRTIWLNEDKAIEAVEALKGELEKYLERDASWKKIYSSARQLLLRTQAGKGHKRFISFYSSRHQFTANAKASDRSLTEIAALLGHKSIKTATAHYGKKTTGKGGLAVEANEENIRVVENHSRANNLTEENVLRKTGGNQNNEPSKNAE